MTLQQAGKGLLSKETAHITDVKEGGFSHVAIYSGFRTAHLVADNRLV